jgi:hypothetical protein
VTLEIVNPMEHTPLVTESVKNHVPENGGTCSEFRFFASFDMHMANRSKFQTTFTYVMHLCSRNGRRSGNALTDLIRKSCDRGLHVTDRVSCDQCYTDENRSRNLWRNFYLNAFLFSLFALVQLALFI